MNHILSNRPVAIRGFGEFSVDEFSKKRNDINTSNLLNEIVFFSHINKRTQYEPPPQSAYFNQNGMASSSSNIVNSNSYANDTNGVYKNEYKIYKPVVNGGLNQSFDSSAANNHYAVSYDNQFNNQQKNRFGDVRASTSSQNYHYSHPNDQQNSSNSGMQNGAFQTDEYAEHAVS